VNILKFIRVTFFLSAINLFGMELVTIDQSGVWQKAIQLVSSEQFQQCELEALVKDHPFLLHEKSSTKNKMLHNALVWQEAIQLVSSEQFQQCELETLVKDHPFLLCEKSQDGNKILFYALTKHNLDAAAFLIAKNADVQDLDEQKSNGAQLFFSENHSEFKGTIEHYTTVSTLLIDTLATKSPTLLKVACNENQDTLLHMAVVNKHPLSSINALMKYIDPNSFNKNNNTALHYAAQSDVMHPVVQYLVLSGANTDIKNKRGYSPLLQAFASSAYSNLRFLMQRNKNLDDAQLNKIFEITQNDVADGNGLERLSALADFLTNIPDRHYSIDQRCRTADLTLFFPSFFWFNQRDACSRIIDLFGCNEKEITAALICASKKNLYDILTYRSEISQRDMERKKKEISNQKSEYRKQWRALEASESDQKTLLEEQVIKQEELLREIEKDLVGQQQTLRDKKIQVARWFDALLQENVPGKEKVLQELTENEQAVKRLSEHIAALEKEVQSLQKDIRSKDEALKALGQVKEPTERVLINTRSRFLHSLLVGGAGILIGVAATYFAFKHNLFGVRMLSR
jgi:ankyrin repeat protein